MTLAQESATEAGGGRVLRFSATVNMLVTPDRATRDDARVAVAEAALCNVDALDRDLLRVIAAHDEMLDKMRALASIGVDRLHIRPMDEYSQHWLDEAIRDIQEVPCLS
jgi:hypothetical protein